MPDSGTRSGLLSKAALLSEFANQQFGSPTLRGKFMRESLMCLTVPPPPKGVNQGAVDQPTDIPMTRRQRLEQHRKDPTCAGCHALMDPLGLPLESFDAIGKYRTTDNGLPVDPSGAFDGHDVADSRALGVAVSQSATVAQCLVRRYYAYAVGHAERRGRRRQRAQHRGDGVQGVRLQDPRSDPGRRDQRRVLHRHPATLARNPCFNPDRTVHPMVKKTLDRRTVLKGVLATGATVSIPLPLMEIMLNGNGTAYAQTATPVPPLFVLWFFGNGSLPGAWKPANTGTGSTGLSVSSCSPCRPSNPT